ncbi:MAG: GNAT family N-acetyltransferase [Butyrivibrio sp.]|nr:GNAT family N-acetyltransferase [Butyrivibrio sp.]
MQIKYYPEPENIMAVKELIAQCALTDNIQYDISPDNIDEPDSVCIVVLNEDNSASAFAIAYIMDSEIEITGLVHPEFRRQGIFSSIIDSIRAKYLKPVVLFGKKNYPNFNEFCSALGFNSLEEECLMKYEGQLPQDFEKMYFETEGDASYTAYFYNENDEHVGYLNVSESENCSTIHDVFIFDELRGMGYGKRMMQTILSDIAKRNKYAILHVSKSNKIAYHIYKSLGMNEISSIIYRKTGD